MPGSCYTSGRVRSLVECALRQIFLLLPGCRKEIQPLSPIGTIPETSHRLCHIRLPLTESKVIGIPRHISLQLFGSILTRTVCQTWLLETQYHGWGPALVLVVVACPTIPSRSPRTPTLGGEGQATLQKHGMTLGHFVVDLQKNTHPTFLLSTSESPRRRINTRHDET